MPHKVRYQQCDPEALSIRDEHWPTSMKALCGVEPKVIVETQLYSRFAKTKNFPLKLAFFDHFYNEHFILLCNPQEVITLVIPCRSTMEWVGERADLTHHLNAEFMEVLFRYKAAAGLHSHAIKIKMKTYQLNSGHMEQVFQRWNLFGLQKPSDEWLGRAHEWDELEPDLEELRRQAEAAHLARVGGDPSKVHLSRARQAAQRQLDEAMREKELLQKEVQEKEAVLETAKEEEMQVWRQLKVLQGIL